MANKIATVKVNVSYTDADDKVQNLAQATIPVEYQAQLHGAYDVPDATEAGTFLINFGSIAAANFMLVKNGLSVPVDLKLNSGAIWYEGLAAGASAILAVPSDSFNTPLSAICVVTHDPQVGDGAIDYHLFGDPT